MNLLIRILTRTNTVDDAKLAARAAERYTEADLAIQVANRILDLTR